jgi:putative ABC transport system permease protein
MALLTLRDLQYRAARIGLVVAGTTVVFALLLLMSGLANHFVLEPAHAVRVIGSDDWVLPAGASGPFTSGATMDPAVAQGIKGVRRADPLITARGTLWVADRPRETIIIGHRFGALGTPRLVRGHAASSDGELVADESTGLHSGQGIRIGSTKFLVSGLTNNATLLAGVPLVFMSIADAQRQVYGGQPVATAIVVRGRPSSVPAGFEVLSNAAVVNDARQPLKHAVASINVIRMLLWLVSAMIIGGVVYLSSMERRRDFAVLKAIGGSTRRLMASLASQGVAIAVVAALLAVIVQRLLAPSFPLRVEVSQRSMLELPAVAVTVALLASAAGLRRVVHTDPAVAFTGPGA